MLRHLPNGIAGPDGALICDLDNTLSDTRHREYLAPATPEGDWEPYCLACVDDPCIEWIAHIVRHWLGPVLILSARNEVAMPETLAWLKEQEIDWEVVQLRPLGDTRNNLEYKAWAIEQFLLAGFDPALILDDHPGVIQYAASIGLSGLWVSRPENPHFPTLLNAEGAVHAVEPNYHREEQA